MTCPEVCGGLARMNGGKSEENRRRSDGCADQQDRGKEGAGARGDRRACGARDDPARGRRGIEAIGIGVGMVGVCGGIVDGVFVGGGRFAGGASAKGGMGTTGFEAGVQRGIFDCGVGEAAAVYGDDPDGGAAAAVETELGDGNSDAAVVGRGASGQCSGDVFVRVGCGTVCAVSGERAARLAGRRHGRDRRRILGGRAARDLCGMVDRADGLAAAGGGVGAREHHHHHYLFDRARRIQSRHCGIDEGFVFGGGWCADMGNVLVAILFADVAGEYCGRSVTGGVSGARAGGGRKGQQRAGESLAGITVGRNGKSGGAGVHIEDGAGNLRGFVAEEIDDRVGEIERSLFAAERESGA